MFYSKILDHDNGIIKENFFVNCENTDRLSIKLLLINKEKYNIDFYKYNYIDIIYNDNVNTSLININENSISSNLTKITDNESNISSNLTKITDNESNISSNLTKITNSESNISSNLTKITDNESNISSNLSKITDNESNISSNLTKIKELNQNKIYLKKFRKYSIL